jgi:hypothetical protein
MMYIGISLAAIFFSSLTAVFAAGFFVPGLAAPLLIFSLSL